MTLLDDLSIVIICLSIIYGWYNLAILVHTDLGVLFAALGAFSSITVVMQYAAYYLANHNESY